MANYVLDQGLAGITSVMSSTIVDLSVGTGTTAVDPAQTALVAVITGSGLDKGAATVTQQTTTTANDTLRLVKAWTVTGTKAITEIGAGATGSGTLYARCLTSATKNVSSGDQFTATVSLVFTN